MSKGNKMQNRFEEIVKKLGPILNAVSSFNLGVLNNKMSSPKIDLEKRLSSSADMPPQMVLIKDKNEERSHYINQYSARLTELVKRGSFTSEDYKNITKTIENKRYLHISAEIEREIEKTAEALPPSQKERYLKNVKRDEMFQDKCKGDLFEAMVSRKTYGSPSWAMIETKEWLSAISSMTKDPELVNMEDLINKSTSSFSWLELDSILERPLIMQKVLEAASHSTTFADFINSELTTDTRNWFGTARQITIQNTLEYVRDSKNIDVSTVITNVLLTNDINLSHELINNKLLSLVSSEDMEKIKKHYVAVFTKEHVIDKTSPVQEPDISLLEHLLNVPRTDVLMSWTHVSPARLAVVLSHGYDIETLIPILETYQGNLALEGVANSNDLLSDIRGYLKPNHPESKFDVSSELQMN